MEAALQKDAFLVFRALCKLSVRASETATGTDMTAIRGKVSILTLCCILSTTEFVHMAQRCKCCLHACICIRVHITVMNCQQQLHPGFCSFHAYLINKLLLFDISSLAVCKVMRGTCNQQTLYFHMHT